MDPNYGFNSPSVGPAKPAASMSRPPRLAKFRKPLAGHRPTLSRPVSQWVTEDSGTGPGISSAKPDLQNAGRGFVFGSANSSSSSSFNESVLNSDPQTSNVVDELRKLKIESEKASANSEYTRNMSSGSYVGTRSNVDLSGRNHSSRSVDESLVSELPDEMRQLYIESQHFGKGYGGNVEMELPNKIKKLNIRDYEDDGSKNVLVGRNDNVSSNGSLGTMLPDKMRSLNIKETLYASANQKVHNDFSSEDKDKAAFGKSGKCNERVDLNIPSAIGNNSNHVRSKTSSRFSAETMHSVQTENMGDEFLHNVSGSSTSAFNFQAGLQSNNDGSQVSYESKNVSTPVPLVGGTEKKVEFSFTSKLDNIASQNVEFKTPDPKGHLAFAFNWKGETKRESAKDIGLKKKKGKWKKTAQVPLMFGQNFVFQENMQQDLESSEQYSPMDVSPYEEIVADNSFSRETSVASEDSFHLHDINSSTEECLNASNDMAEEKLVSAAEPLNIDECDIRGNVVQDDESSSCVHEGIGVESSEEGAVSGVETESFKSATDELDYSSDSFVTAADDEVSSRFSIQRQDSDGGTRFNYDTTLPDVGQTSFIFAADLSESSASLGVQKNKNRIKVNKDSFSSTPYVKVSSSFPAFQVSGSSLLSPEQDQKGNFSNTLSRRREKSEQVKELELKQDSTTAVSIAAQESCEKWRLRGNQAYTKGDFLKAEDCYTHGVNCISQSEASRSCLRALMLCYSNRSATRKSLGRMREALQDCMKAATLDPNFLKVQVRAASCYLALGDVENANLHFTKCLQVGPDVCADRKILVEASDGLEKAQKVAECMKQAQELLGRRTSCDIDSAVSLITEAMTISSFSEKLLHMKVDALLILKKYEDVIKLCEQLLISGETNFLASGVDRSGEFHGSNLNKAPSFRIWCWSVILKSYFYLGRLENALVFLKKHEESVSLVKRTESKTLESMIPIVGTICELLHHKTAGNEAYQSGNHAEAVEHYTAAITCSVEPRPFAAVCFCNRGAAYRSMGQIIDALADCSIAIALDGKYFKAVNRRIAMYEMVRDYGQAVTDLQKLISLLTREVDKMTNQSGPSDKQNCAKELREARLKLSEMEEAARKEIPLNMYLILGIEPSASVSEIRKAFRKAALKYHPDKAGQSLTRNQNQDDDDIWKEIAEEVRKDAERLFKMIAEAYAVLSDPTKRSRYDLEEEMRNVPTTRGSNARSTSKMYSDFQNYPSERSDSRRQWQEVRRAYESTSRGTERNWYF